MKILNATQLDRALLGTLTSDQASWVYNGLDCCVTLEVYDKLMLELEAAGPEVQYTYECAMAKQAPFLDMSLRGLLVDQRARKKTILALEKDLEELDKKFQRIMREVFGHQLNWSSPMQLKTLFYGELGFKEIKKRNTKGQYVATVGEDALLQLSENLLARPLCNFILAMRDIKKQIGFLQTPVDPDGRFRTHINIAGTNTGRSSSSASDFGSGTNLQNVDTKLRYPFIAGPKKILVNIDLEQADARNVGAIIHDLFYDSHGAEEAAKFLDACESGDLHTRVCSMAWTELPWTEDKKENRAIADLPSGHGFSYRDMAKRLGHGTNYLGTPNTMAKHTKTAVPVIADFQRRYFAGFPLIKAWHEWVIQQVKEFGVITTPFGRVRHFFGRGDDPSTHRKAVAYAPQSMTGHEMDMGILNLWRHKPEVNLEIQVHDSILFEVPWLHHERHIEEALQLLRYEHQLKGGRTFCVPLEAMVGWNWGKVERDKKTKQIISNPYGIEVWTGKELRQPPVGERLQDYL